MRRPASIAAVALLAITIGGCSGDPEPAAPAPSTAASTAPATTDDPTGSATVAPGTATRPPISDPTPPADWPGDDAAFLTALAAARETSGAAPYGSDAESVGLGRDFCTVLSGGGLVGDKVAFWATQYSLEGDIADLGNAAGPTYCPTQYAAYVPVTEDTAPAKPTPTERADLFRFIVGRIVDDPGAADDVSDERIRARADDFCGRLREPDANISELTNLDPQNEAERLQAAYAVGLGFSYCPDVFGEVMQHP